MLEKCDFDVIPTLRVDVDGHYTHKSAQEPSRTQPLYTGIHFIDSWLGALFPETVDAQLLQHNNSLEMYY